MLEVWGEKLIGKVIMLFFTALNAELFENVLAIWFPTVMSARALANILTVALIQY